MRIIKSVTSLNKEFRNIDSAQFIHLLHQGIKMRLPKMCKYMTNISGTELHIGNLYDMMQFMRAIENTLLDAGYEYQYVPESAGFELAAIRDGSFVKMIIYYDPSEKDCSVYLKYDNGSVFLQDWYKGVEHK